jgi:hypothetical protein
MVLVATAMEEPLDRALAYSGALDLIGFGLNRIGDDHGRAVLAIAEVMTLELVMLQKSWRQMMAACARRPTGRSARRRSRSQD